ncbi:MAG: hypothetical protein IKY92_09845 [Akkermansia sp.]|nr:hypothetical protein [Akkermansia sp.]
MKGKSVAGLVAGLLLAGAAGAVLGRRRRRSVAVPAKPEQKFQPEETPEHAALREILERSVAYNDALYERVSVLERTEDAAGRPQLLKSLTFENQEERKNIDALRAALQARLNDLGYGFSGIDGFVDLISEFRLKTLEQQDKHLQLYERVRLLPGVTDSPELHAYLKLGYSDTLQKQADTDAQIRRAMEEQREIMLRAGRALARVNDVESAAAVQGELLAGNKRYQELTERMCLYRYDDPEGAADAVAALKSMYAALIPPLQAQAVQLQQKGCFGDARLVDILGRLLPAGVQN